MKITYIVMNQELPFSELSIDNNFQTQEAAESAILHFFQQHPESRYRLWIVKQFTSPN